MARRSKLNQTLIESIGNGLRAGNYTDTVLSILRVSPSTYYYWLAEAEQLERFLASQQELGKDPQQIELDYPSLLKLELLETVKEATATAEARALAVIEEAGFTHGQWTAAAWFLERKFPEKWGRKDRIDIGDARDRPLSPDEVNLSKLALEDAGAAELITDLIERISRKELPDDEQYEVLDGDFRVVEEDTLKDGDS